MLMNEFLDNIKAKFGDSGVVGAHLWMNFYTFSVEVDDMPTYVNFVKTQMAIIVEHFAMNAKTFSQIVKASESYLDKLGQTVH